MPRLPARYLMLAVCGLLQACATTPSGDMSARIDALLPADAILLGEQHDAAAHQQFERDTVLDLARRGRLAAMAIEMAEQGNSTTGLQRSANEAEVRHALRWNDAGWPWAAYGPVVMAAVRAGVPVLGANLPRGAMRDAMAHEALDTHLPATALEQQRERIRNGHCNLLPASQIAPMTRIQIARDAAMARTVTGALRPGKTVLLVAGGGHVARGLGVPTHLPPGVRGVAVQMAPGQPDGPARADADVVWETPALPAKDHCASLEQQFRR